MNEPKLDAALAESNARYLSAMAAFASRLRDPRIDHAAWAEALKYIRVNGSGLRPISLCNDNPCGALDGYDGSQENVDERLLQARQAAVIPLSPKADKPELRLQARLIEHAIRSPETLADLLHLADECDELRFVTDELKVNNIRADVVLVGRKDGVYFPVFIELKNGRHLDRLLKQLENIVRYVGEDAVTRRAFTEFVMASIGREGPFDFTKRIGIIVWPALADHARASARTCELLEGRHVLEFSEGWTRQPLPRMGLRFTRRVYARRRQPGAVGAPA